jgi:ABC-2 type transport system permease protein
VSRGSFRSVALAIAWRSVHNMLHNPSLLLPGIAFPLMNLIAFAGGLSQLRHLPGFDFAPGYAGFQYVFVLLQSAAFGGVFTGFGIARDFEYGFARRLMLAASHRSGIVAGFALAAIVRWLTTIAVTTSAAFLVGMSIHGNGIDLVGLFTLALLVNLCGLLWACGVAMRFRSIQAGPLMQTPVFLLLFFSPVYVPLDLLRGWMHGIAQANPITRVLEAGRSLLAGQPVEVLAGYGAAAGMGVLLALWAFRGLRAAERTV